MFNSKKLFGLLAGLILSFSAPLEAQVSGATSPFICADGSVTGPCYTFTSNPNDGFYRAGSHQVGVAINGINVGTWNSTGYSSPFASTATSYFATGGTNPVVTTSGLQIWLNS